MNNAATGATFDLNQQVILLTRAAMNQQKSMLTELGTGNDHLGEAGKTHAAESAIAPQLYP
jgi:hypothetical protein